MSQNDQSPIYGGQAVIEGVMFAGQSVNVTAVRRKSTNEISYYEVPKNEKLWVRKLKKIPLLRGLVAIIESSAKGAQHLNYALEVYTDEMEKTEGDKKSGTDAEAIDQDADSNDTANAERKKKGFSLSMIIGVAAVGVLSFVFSKLIFTLVPVAIEDFIFGDIFVGTQWLHNLLEGLIKLVFLLAYIYLISLTPPIKRLFQYHGAEHKVISTYEAGVELTVSNVQKHSRLHYRCGSSFIILTILIGILIYSLVFYGSIWERMLQRIILLPLVIGVSYEFLRFTNGLRDTPILKYLGYPGLWLQLLTTKAPENDQVEVAISSFNRMLAVDKEYLAKKTL